MKYYIQLIVLISAILSLVISSYVISIKAYDNWDLQRATQAQIFNLQENLRDLRIRVHDSNIQLEREDISQEKVFLRDALLDFNLMLKQLPKGIRMIDIIYGKPIAGDISATVQYNNEGIPFISLSVVLGYTDYLTVIAVFLEWFAYSSLPIVVEKFSLERQVMTIDLKLYGLLE